MFPRAPVVRHWRALTATSPLLAHAGGFSWDEALLVMTPLLVIAGLLWLANRRAGRLDRNPGPDPDAPAQQPVPGDQA